MIRQVNNVELKSNPKRSLFGATIGFFVGFAAVSLFGPTAKLLDETMQMTAVQLGVLVAMPNLSGSLLRIPFGAWVDSTGGRKPFIWLLGLSLAGMAGLMLMFYAIGEDQLTMVHYPMFLLLALLCGCGIASFSVGIGQVSYWFPKDKQGWALGFYAGLGNIAPGLFSYLIPLLIGVLALTGTYGVWLAVLMVGMGLYLLYGHNAYYFQLIKHHPAEKARTKASQLGQAIFPSGGVWDGLWRAAKIWRTWALVLLYFTTFGGFLALTVWFPTYWQEYLRMDITTAGAMTMTYSVLASLIRVPGGSISDRIGGVRTIFLALTCMLLGAVLLAFIKSLVFGVLGLILMAMGMGVNNAGVFKLVPEYISEAVGGGAGWVGGLGALGGFLIPPLLGWFVELFGVAGYARGFIVFIALALVSLMVATILQRTATVLKRQRVSTTIN